MREREARVLIQTIQSIKREGEASPHWCKAPHLHDGNPYRLEPKPNGNEDRLRKNGIETVRANGMLYAIVPLGVHGVDHLDVDILTGDVSCSLCKERV